MNSSKTYRAIATCIKKTITAETIYRGLRPNSSLRDAVTRGTRPKPSAYTETDRSTLMPEAFKSRSIEGMPIEKLDAAAAV